MSKGSLEFDEEEDDEFCMAVPLTVNLGDHGSFEFQNGDHVDTTGRVMRFPKGGHVGPQILGIVELLNLGSREIIPSEDQEDESDCLNVLGFSDLMGSEEIKRQHVADGAMNDFIYKAVQILSRIHNRGLPVTWLFIQFMKDSGTGEPFVVVRASDAYREDNESVLKDSLHELITDLSPIIPDLENDMEGYVLDRGDVRLSLLEALGKDEDFDFGFWLTALKRITKCDNHDCVVAELGMGNTVEVFPKVEKFWNSFDQCMQEWDGLRCDASLAKACDQNEPIKLEDGSDLFLDKLKAKKGETAVAIPTLDSEYYLKVFKKKGGCAKLRMNRCNEKAVMDALEGLEGDVPMAHNLDPSTLKDDRCRLISIAEDSVGLYTVQDSLGSITLEKYFRIIAKAIGLIEKLHEAGFVHNDLHPGNIVFRDFSDPASTAKLIDFTFTRPRVNRNGQPLAWEVLENPRKSDIANLALYPAKIFDSINVDPEVVDKFSESIARFVEYTENGFGVFEKPDYQRWIHYFEAMAASLDSATNKQP